MDKELKKALAQMTEGANAGRVEEAVQERIGGSKTIGRQIYWRRPIRMMAAALVILMLTVGVCAAVWNRIQIVAPEGEGNGYSILVNAGSDVKLSRKVRKQLAEYRQTAKATEQGMYSQIRFTSWQEMAEFLDCGVLVSDLFAGKGTELLVSWSEDGDLRTLSAWISFELPDSRALCSITMNIPTGWGEKWNLYWMNENVTLDENGTLVYEDPEKNISYTGETYTTLSGIPVTMVSEPTLYKLDRKITECTNTQLYIYQSGILYTLSIDRVEAEKASDTVKMVADSLH